MSFLASWLNKSHGLAGCMYALNAVRAHGFNDHSPLQMIRIPWVSTEYCCTPHKDWARSAHSVLCYIIYLHFFPLNFLLSVINILSRVVCLSSVYFLLDALHLDAFHLDALYLDALYLDALHLDALHLDALHLDALHLDVLVDRYQPLFFYCFLFRAIIVIIICKCVETWNCEATYL